VAPREQQVAAFEIDLARRLAEAGCPVAALEPRTEPRVYEQDGFVVTLWTYYPLLAGALAPADYARALERLHTGMRRIDVATPHFLDRVSEAQQIAANREHSPQVSRADRELLINTLGQLRRAITERGAPEQLLHGEPHPGNVLGAVDGPRFIDLETCCRGPVEFDLAHAPPEVAALYPGADQDLLGDCRGLVLAMVTAWRWEAKDRFPNRWRVARELVRILREGPPWPTLDAVMRRLEHPALGLSASGPGPRSEGRRDPEDAAR
jgi:hypothetical protein